MSDSERSIALTTACDDLQAQVEAGDRSVRHIDRDLTLLRDALRATVAQTETLGALQRHIGDLQRNMREQRSALREVRREATKLCAAMAETLGRVQTLVDEQQVLERPRDALVADHAGLGTTLPEPPDTGSYTEHRRDPFADDQRFTTRRPTSETSGRDSKI
jgi:predicted  nucleic acid-binding Zn-ribbon protein